MNTHINQKRLARNAKKVRISNAKYVRISGVVRQKVMPIGMSIMKALSWNPIKLISSARSKYNPVECKLAGKQ